MTDELFSDFLPAAPAVSPAPEGSAAGTVVSVMPLTGVGKVLAYRVPPALEATVRPGCLVRAPLLNRSELAVVRGFGADGDFPVSRMKFLHSLVQPHPVLTPDLIELAAWMSRYYAASLDSVLDTMLPSAVKRGLEIKRRRLLRLIKLPEPDVLEKLKRRAPKQAAVVEFLSQQTVPVARELLVSRLEVTTGVLTALVTAGLAEETWEQVDRSAYQDELGEAERKAVDKVDLNPEQLCAAEALAGAIDTGTFSTWLLHGVTGSGKTEVYLAALKHALARNGGVVFLVPEVALTPQTVGRLRARLEEVAGVRAVVWHSGLSEGERYDSWHALASGEARVVVGARSAIFAPVKDLRLIIVDEEHEPAYKQDETPRYHGRDVSVMRAKLAGAVCVLGSATPSLETLHNATLGKYRTVRLTKRVDDRQLPLLHVVDMTRETLKEGGAVLLSRKLRDLMVDRFEKKEQTILFLNRRGYSTSMVCPDCGWVANCNHCSISMTWHKGEDMLRCHLCGFEHKPPQRCPTCKSEKVRWKGFGTQRIEDLVQKVLPKATVVRIDADALKKKDLLRVLLADFRKGKIDVLVGTQMIAKGLDFPNVTLVGLIAADLSLHIPDFRSAERTFQLLVQVSGRAGRGDRAGEVVVQTFIPASAPVQFARRGDFDGFLAEELENRRQFNYPPYRHLIQHLFRGPNLEKVAFFAEQWAKHLEANPIPGVEIRGPAPAPMEKIKDHYRYHLWYFTDSASRVAPLLVALRQTFAKDKDVIDVLDVDPVSLG